MVGKDTAIAFSNEQVQEWNKDKINLRYCLEKDTLKQKYVDSLVLLKQSYDAMVRDCAVQDSLSKVSKTSLKKALIVQEEKYDSSEKYHLKVVSDLKKSSIKSNIKIGVGSGFGGLVLGFAVGLLVHFVAF